MSVMALSHRMIAIAERKSEIERELKKDTNIIELQEELNKLNDEERNIIAKMGGC